MCCKVESYFRCGLCVWIVTYYLNLHLLKDEQSFKATDLQSQTP